MKIILKRINKNLLSAICPDITNINGLISAQAFEEVRVNDNLYALVDIEAKDTGKEINFGLISEEEESSYTFLQFIYGDVVFIRKDIEGNYIDVTEEDMDFLYLNHSNNAIISNKTNAKYDVLEIPKHII